MKGNKLVIAVILALIVCLVLIPTCAFADNDGAGVDDLAYTAENPDNAGGDNPSGAPDGGNGNGAGSGSGDANQSGNVSESGNDGSSDAGTEGGTEGGAENGDDSNKGEGEKQPEPGDEEEGKLPDFGEEENESEENEDSEQFNAVLPRLFSRPLRFGLLTAETATIRFKMQLTMGATALSSHSTATVRAMVLLSTVKQ